MADALRSISTRTTSQTEQASPLQVPNSAGGFSFALDDWGRLRRFLILGTEGGTYYISQQALTKENAEIVIRLAAQDPKRVVDLIIEISLAGRAPKVNPAIFALAVAASMSGTPEDRAYALAALPLVCRTGTHLFLFVGYVEQFRGWGRALRRAVGDWYLDKKVDDVAYQMVKYRQREGWVHRDLLRLAHPDVHRLDPEEDKGAYDALFAWAVGKEPKISLPQVVSAFEAVQAGGDPVSSIREFRLPWEALPDAALTRPEVWTALVETGMGQTALIRNLPRLTRLGVLKGDLLDTVVTQITDEGALRRGRVHPLAMLVAQETYASGQGFRGKDTWTPVRQVVDALDAAYYASFGTIEPTGKRYLLGVDVSGSMTADTIAGSPITPRTGAMAMAMATARIEKDCIVTAFASGGPGYWTPSKASRGQYLGYRSDGICEVAISPRQRLDDIIRATDALPFGGTDCSLPMRYALDKGLAVDVFVTYTDSETWSGDVHPHQALAQYRERTGISAKMVVVGMTSNGFSIADPSDAGELDVVGFDTSTPNLISEFALGRI